MTKFNKKNKTGIAGYTEKQRSISLIFSPELSKNEKLLEYLWEKIENKIKKSELQ